MLDTLAAQPADALLALIKLYEADPRAEKIDLGVGVYRSDDGATPVFGAIKAAEAQLVASQDSKAYLGPDGDMGFVRGLMPFIFGKADPGKQGRLDGMQVPGGTGGVRLAIELARDSGVGRVFMGVPSWPNHAQIARAAGVEIVTFNHATPDGAADIAALRAALAESKPGDALLVHGCCHNPTGVDYTMQDWAVISALLQQHALLPILDLAYQGLGGGMEEDAAGIRLVLETAPEALIAYSCDKNFGVYRDRVGALYIMAKEAGQLPAILSNAHAMARASWSMPPDHGAAAIRLILDDPAMTALWLAELDVMRDRMRAMRQQLGAAGKVGSVDLAPIAAQNGLFAILKLAPEQIAALRADHAVYMAGSGRINIAGLTSGNIDRFIAALAKV